MKIFLCCCLFFAVPAWADEAALGGNLAALLDYAREHNPDFLASRLDADAAQQRVQPAAALPDPMLRMELIDMTKQGATLLPSQVGSTRYLFSQSVPWLGKRDLLQQAAEAQVAQNIGQVAATWSDLANKIKQVYAQQFYTVANTRLTQQTLISLDNLTQIAQTRYANGIATQQEVILAQLEAGNLRSELFNLDNELHHWQARMNALLARPLSSGLVTPTAWRTLPALPDVNTLINSSPLVQSAEARVMAAEKARDLVYLNRYPTLNLGIAPTQIGNAVRTWDVMFEFNLPLQQESRRSQEREATANLAAAQARKAAVVNQLQANLAESVSGLETARRTETLTVNRLLPQSELTYQSALVGYSNGKVDFATLLEAQRQVFKAQQQQLKAQLDTQLRFAEVEWMVGM